MRRETITKRLGWQSVKIDLGDEIVGPEEKPLAWKLA